ncbi:hypothetical protein CYMTET_13566 [Cymbomonas tetramitiformis]|uniref:Uncharacterized protein n=1 Tax=Cymbomonas tetramitiformis TaxID=36881 RepID=A0AAE0GHV2_9CHLO|nr:hypothetical protein CYMTET_13566 [Cymbomonas tetramitiformis]|eukprot:gene878-1373_t
MSMVWTTRRNALLASVLMAALFTFARVAIVHDAAPSWLTSHEGTLRYGTTVKIPKIIHQTHASTLHALPFKEEILSWRTRNPSWSYQFYTNEDCDFIVKHEMPDYYQTYRALPNAIQRSDFFRYLIVMHRGGVYVDVDTTCMQPLGEVILATDTFVVGYENIFDDYHTAHKRTYSKQAQLSQWFFAATPGHPVLRAVCNHINAHNRIPDVNTNILDSTGPGIWTGIILNYKDLLNVNKLDGVRMLSQYSVGYSAYTSDYMNPYDDEILARHKFVGSWKTKSTTRVKPDDDLALNRDGCYPINLRNMEYVHVCLPYALGQCTTAEYNMLIALRRRGYIMTEESKTNDRAIWDIVTRILKDINVTDGVFFDVNSPLNIYGIATRGYGITTYTRFNNQFSDRLYRLTHAAYGSRADGMHPRVMHLAPNASLQWRKLHDDFLTQYNNVATSRVVYLQIDTALSLSYLQRLCATFVARAPNIIVLNVQTVTLRKLAVLTNRFFHGMAPVCTIMQKNAFDAKFRIVRTDHFTARYEWATAMTIATTNKLMVQTLYVLTCRDA